MKFAALSRVSRNQATKELGFPEATRAVYGKTHQEFAPEADCTEIFSKCTANCADDFLDAWLGSLEIAAKSSIAQRD